jgi:hypothetical protein
MNLIQFMPLFLIDILDYFYFYKTIIVSSETSRFEKNDWFLGKVVSQIEIVNVNSFKVTDKIEIDQYN